MSTIDWAALRARYDAGDETLAEIARDFGTSVTNIHYRARKELWPYRPGKKRRPKRRLTPRANPEQQDTTENPTDRDPRALVKRLLSVVDRQIAEIEERLMREPDPSQSDDKTARTLSALAGTLDKILTMERALDKPEEESGRDIVALRKELAQRLDRLGGRGRTPKAH